MLVQPDVHCRRPSKLAPIAEFLRELLSRAQAAIKLEHLHEIDDRYLPIEVFILRVCDLLDYLFDLILRHRLAGCHGRSSSRAPDRRSCRSRSRSLCGSTAMLKNCRCDIAEDAHLRLQDLYLTPPRTKLNGHFWQGVITPKLPENRVACFRNPASISRVCGNRFGCGPHRPSRKMPSHRRRHRFCPYIPRV